MHASNVKWASNEMGIKLLNPKRPPASFIIINGEKCRFHYRTHITITTAEGGVWNQQSPWKCGVARELLLFAV